MTYCCSELNYVSENIRYVPQTRIDVVDDTNRSVAVVGCRMCKLLVEGGIV